MSSPEEPERADLKYFAAIPWCAKLLSDPDIIIWQSPTDQPNRPPNDDNLFAVTLSTPEAIPASVTFYRKQQPPSSDLSSSIFVDELRALVALGPGISGYPGVAHGGVVTAIFDEILGWLIGLNKERRAVRGPHMTAYLNTTFSQPVRLPCAVLVIAKLVKRDERKFYIAGTMQDENGQELAKAETLFVRVNKGKL